MDTPENTPRDAFNAAREPATPILLIKASGAMEEGGVGRRAIYSLLWQAADMEMDAWLFSGDGLAFVSKDADDARRQQALDTPGLWRDSDTSAVMEHIIDDESPLRVYMIVNDNNYASRDNTFSDQVRAFLEKDETSTLSVMVFASRDRAVGESDIEKDIKSFEWDGHPSRTPCVRRVHERMASASAVGMARSFIEDREREAQRIDDIIVADRQGTPQKRKIHRRNPPPDVNS